MVSLTLGGGRRLTPLLLAGCLCWSNLISANGFATPNSGPLLRYDDLVGLLRNGSRGQFVESSQGLEQLWQDMPTYASKYLEYRWSQTEKELDQSEYPRDEMVEDTVEHARCILAGHLARFALEAGNLAQAQEYFAMSKGTKRIRVRNGLLQGDVHFALGNYTAAIDCYQDNISLGKDPTRMFEMMRGPLQDDVLFSKVALAYSKLGRSELAKKNWDYAAQLQLARGLYLEAIVSYLRMGDWKVAQGVASEGLLSMYYPTVATILQKGPAEDKQGASEAVTLLENALYGLIQGDYSTACQAFAKVSDDDHEKWGLVSILLRERQLDDVADCYSELRDHDPFANLKRGVLRKNVQAEKLWGALPVSVEEETTAEKKEQAPPAAKEESKNVLDALFGYGRRSNHDESIQDTPQTLLLKAKETLHDFAAGTIDYLIAEYVGSSFTSTSFHSQEEEDAFFQAMEERMAHLDQALANPMTLPTSVWVRATFCKSNAGLALAERCNLNIANGRMLAAADKKRDGPTKAITSQAVLSSAGTILSYVPPKPVRNEPLRQEREAILDQCWERLESEEGMSTSLVALVLARQGKSGAVERRLVAEIFGNASAPLLKTREAEAYEDMREGTGQRAEELFRQLADQQKDDDGDDGESWSNRKQHYQNQLVSALEKQEKYKDAIEAMEALEASGYYQQQMGGPGYYLLQVGELYQKMGDLDRAEQKYRELSLIDRSLEWEGQWTVYGFVSLGDIALERGNLEEALAEFDRGIEVARKHLESIRGKDDDITTESNAISGLANAWMYSGDSLYEHGFSEEALKFYEECRAAAQTENEFWNNNFREGYERRISAKIAQARLQQRMDQVAQEED